MYLCRVLQKNRKQKKMAEVPTSQLATELVKEISECLTKGLLKEAQEAINDNKYSLCLKDNCWDLIPVVARFLEEETLRTNSELFECCEGLLEVVAEKSNPEEALLEFIEQAELAKKDTKFIAILKALQKTLLRLCAKRGRSLEWTFNTIQAHVSELPLPGEYGLENEEKTLLDTDSEVDRITSLYLQLIPFYKPFIGEVALPNNTTKEHTQRRDILACFMLQLLGKPLACLDLEVAEGCSKNRARLCAEHIMTYLDDLVSDCFKFLYYVTDCRKTTSNDKNGVYEDAIEDVFACEEKTPLLSLGVYYYLLLCENIGAASKPNVYHPLYIFQNSLHLATLLLKQPEQFLTRKGILLSYALICGTLVDNFPYDVLDDPVHCNFCKNLTNVMIYSDIKQYRETCLKIFKTYLFKFDTKGRYLLISNLMTTITHVNTRGYLITQYKDMLREILAKDENKISEYFSGLKLRRMIDTFCLLPEGRESDLMEIGDQIITSLNLLIFLAIRDKYNVTGIWNHFGILEKTFFKPLKEGLNISKAHYELKIKELKDEKHDKKVNVSVCGRKLPQMPYDEKFNVLNCALNSFSALEMLLARVEELIDDGPAISI